MSNNKQDYRAGFLYKFGQKMAIGGEKMMPDAMVIAFVLLLIVFVCGILFTDSGPLDMINYGVDNMWSLATFACSASLSMAFATVLSQTRVMQKFLNGLCSIPKTPVQAIVFGCFLSAVAMWVNWAVAYVLGGLYCVTVAKKVKGVDYPLLVASCYATDMIWHPGFSGTIPLVASTEGSFIAEIVGYSIPVSETMFSPLNVTFCIIAICTLPLLARALMPPKEEAIIANFEVETVEEDFSLPKDKSVSGVDKLEYSRFLSLAVGVGILVYDIMYFARTGLNGLTLDALNLVLLAFALIFVRNMHEFIAHIPDAIKSAWAILVQYPFYAVISGMAAESGLAGLVTDFFASICTAATLPNVLHLSASLVNLFIPGAGSQFAVEAPMYIPAAQKLGASIPTVLNVAAMGDALTNLVQPMWALPFLAYAKLPVKKIIGYCAVFCLYGFILTQILIVIFVHMGLA